MRGIVIKQNSLCEFPIQWAGDIGVTIMSRHFGRKLNVNVYSEAKTFGSEISYSMLRKSIDKCLIGDIVCMGDSMYTIAPLSIIGDTHCWQQVFKALQVLDCSEIGYKYEDEIHNESIASGKSVYELIIERVKTSPKDYMQICMKSGIKNSYPIVIADNIQEVEMTDEQIKMDTKMSNLVEDYLFRVLGVKYILLKVGDLGDNKYLPIKYDSSQSNVELLDRHTDTSEHHSVYWCFANKDKIANVEYDGSRFNINSLLGSYSFDNEDLEDSKEYYETKEVGIDKLNAKLGLISSDIIVSSDGFGKVTSIRLINPDVLFTSREFVIRIPTNSKINSLGDYMLFGKSAEFTLDKVTLVLGDNITDIDKNIVPEGLYIKEFNIEYNGADKKFIRKLMKYTIDYSNKVGTSSHIKIKLNNVTSLDSLLYVRSYIAEAGAITVELSENALNSLRANKKEVVDFINNINNVKVIGIRSRKSYGRTVGGSYTKYTKEIIGVFRSYGKYYLSEFAPFSEVEEYYRGIVQNLGINGKLLKNFEEKLDELRITYECARGMSDLLKFWENEDKRRGSVYCSRKWSDWYRNLQENGKLEKISANYDMPVMEFEYSQWIGITTKVNSRILVLDYFKYAEHLRKMGTKILITGTAWVGDNPGKCVKELLKAYKEEECDIQVLAIVTDNTN